MELIRPTHQLLEDSVRKCSTQSNAQPYSHSMVTVQYSPYLLNSFQDYQFYLLGKCLHNFFVELQIRNPLEISVLVHICWIICSFHFDDSFFYFLVPIVVQIFCQTYSYIILMFHILRKELKNCTIYYIVCFIKSTYVRERDLLLVTLCIQMNISKY